ncbi:MAG: DNA alkylation repair protein [Gemmatimonadota bacterium]|nr:DNA alkylation repair protein [Gemmatimonadota bacterium]
MPNSSSSTDAVPSLATVRNELRAQADPERAIHHLRFFKTGPGQYGEGDRFLGVRVPALRALGKAHRRLPVADALEMLRSEWHEERLLALIMLVDAYERGDATQRQEIYNAYLLHARFINNWDLVDSSAEFIVGAHLEVARNRAVLSRLAKSKSIWERRIAILATFHFIKLEDFAPALRIADILIGDTHDLIHKAVGWMLREIGNRDGKVERAFLVDHYKRMPRTMLRYAIERFPERERQRYLRGDI